MTPFLIVFSLRLLQLFFLSGGLAYTSVLYFWVRIDRKKKTGEKVWQTFQTGREVNSFRAPPSILTTKLKGKYKAIKERAKEASGGIFAVI